MMKLKDIPNDPNGAVLRRMLRNGDDLSQPRNIDFEFIFESRSDAIGYAELLDDKKLKSRTRSMERHCDASHAAEP